MISLLGRRVFYVVFLPQVVGLQDGDFGEDYVGFSRGRGMMKFGMGILSECDCHLELGNMLGNGVKQD